MTPFVAAHNSNTFRLRGIVCRIVTVPFQNFKRWDEKNREKHTIPKKHTKKHNSRNWWATGSLSPFLPTTPFCMGILITKVVRDGTRVSSRRARHSGTYFWTAHTRSRSHLSPTRRGDRPLAWSNVRNEPTHNQPVVQLLRGATSQIRSYGRYDGGRGEGTKNKRNKRKQNVFKRLFSWVLFLFSSFGFVEQRGINDNKTIFLVPFGCVTAWRHPPPLHHFETWIICLEQRERKCLLADHFYDELSGELTFRQTCEIHIMLQIINECSRIFCSSLSLPYTLHYQHSTYGTDAQYLHINFRVSYSIR